MNDPSGHHPGTIMLRQLSVVTGAPDARLVTTLTPARLADLLLAAPPALRADVALIEPGGHVADVSILRGTACVAEMRVSADVANAAVARLAVMAGLDPLVESRSMEGRANVRRLAIRSGGDSIDALVGVGADGRGLAAEIRILSVNGRPLDLRSPGPLRRCTRCGALQPAARNLCEHDGSPLCDVEDAAVIGGTVGAYRIVSSLGEGSGGSVFAAEHALIGRPVAIKIPHLNLAGDPDMAHRFLSEARAACQLRHRNVIEVTDFGILRDGRAYMVMERLRGEPLDVSMAERGAFPPTTALLLAREMTAALAAAHDAGIAHNDLKPANVMVLEGSTDEAPQIKLIDFGCAALVGTVEGGLFGTPGYMAPERILGHASDGRSDLYAVGMMLHEMIAGEPAHDAPSVQELLLAQLRKPLPPLASPLGVLPVAVHRLVARAGATKPEERHQSTGELLADIDRCLAVLAREGSWRWCP